MHFVDNPAGSQSGLELLNKHKHLLNYQLNLTGLLFLSLHMEELFLEQQAYELLHLALLH